MFAPIACMACSGLCALLAAQSKSGVDEASWGVLAVAWFAVAAFAFSEI